MAPETDSGAKTFMETHLYLRTRFSLSCSETKIHKKIIIVTDFSLEPFSVTMTFD
jgi:hypothetical protein